MSKHALTLHDPITNADQRVEITIDRHGDQWSYSAHIGGHVVLAAEQFLWFEREEQVLALAQERARAAMRARDPRAFKA